LGRARRSRTIGRIARLLLFARRPYHLSDEEADGWIRRQTTALDGIAAVTGIELSRITAPSAGAAWDWLIEMHLERPEDAAVAARDSACRQLVAELRLLGMNPSLVLVDGSGHA
jgi:hypothetical protein